MAAGLLFWILTRSLSTILLENQMIYVTKTIQEGIQRISNESFYHLHQLDLGYHKQGARNSVFAVNRALRSLEMGLRFFFGLFTRMVVQVSFLALALGTQCGPFYMFNLLVTFLAYVQFTIYKSKQRMPIVRTEKDF